MRPITYFCKLTERRFRFSILEMKPFILLYLFSTSVHISAASQAVQENITPLLPAMQDIGDALSNSAAGKAKALADYAVGRIAFREKHTLSGKTLEYFLDAVRNDPEAVPPLMVLTVHWATKGDRQSLIDNLLPIAKDNPEAARLNVVVARTLAAEGRTEEAVHMLENALKKTGVDSTAGVSAESRASLILKLVQFYGNNKEWDKGEELLDSAFESEDLRNNLTARLAAVEFYSKCADQGPDGFFAGWNKRRYRKKLDENLDLFEKLCAETDLRAMSVFPILKIYKRYSMPERARNLILEQLLLRPYNAQMFIILAQVYTDNGDYANAFRVWNIIVNSSRYPDIKKVWAKVARQLNGPPDLYYQLGLAAIKCGRWEDAIKAFDWAILEHPENTGAYFQLGYAYIQQEKFQKAIENFTKLAGSMPEAAYFTAHCYRRMGKYHKALNAMNEAANLAEQNKNTDFLKRDFYMEYAFIADKAGDTGTTEEILLKLLKKYPDEPALNNFLGYLWADHNKNLDNAEKMIKKALEADKDNAAYLDSMAWVLFRKKQYQKALTYIRKALKYSAQPLPDAVICDHAGDIYAAAGKKKSALQYWQKALDIYSDETDSEKIRNKIRKITEPDHS